MTRQYWVTFYSFGYKNATIYVKLYGDVEEVYVRLPDYTIARAKSVHAAKIIITRRLKNG